MYKILLVCMLLFSGNSFSQNFFPMSIINKYQYQNNYIAHVPQVGNINGTSFYSYFPVRDTIIGNSHFFRFPLVYITFPFASSCFYSYDSLQQLMLVSIPGDTTIRTAINFNVPSDSFFTSYLTGVPLNYKSQGRFFSSVMGHNVECFGFSNYNTAYMFVSGIGLYYYTYSRMSDDNKFSVVSAIIDSIIYNPITLQISDFYPLTNRPLDTFPFMMHCEYACNYDLTDTFKLNFVYQHNSVTYDSGSVKFNSSHDAYIVLPSGAVPGDVLKVRAEIRDHSIFNNVANYPDTGYASILILDPTVGINDKNKNLSFKLDQNYPNPFNPSTIIRYEIPYQSHVKMTLYNILGQSIMNIIDEVQEVGSREVELNGKNLPAGIYFYTLEATSFTRQNNNRISKKLVLLK